MNVKQIREFDKIRQKTRAYLSYILERNLNYNVKNGDIQAVLEKLEDLFVPFPRAENIYAIDPNGIQSVGYLTQHKRMDKIKGTSKGKDLSQRSRYIDPIDEERCTISEPYPSLVNNKMLVTASYPIYDDDDELLGIICVDFTLSNILKVMRPSAVDSAFNFASRLAYISFTAALSLISLLLFTKGILIFISFGIDVNHIDMQKMFKATVLLTLSLALFDLVKAIFEEEVISDHSEEENHDHHLTMVRFLGSIIIALSIEALMLVFKYALTDPDKLIYAIALIGGVSVLLYGLGVYMKTSTANDVPKKKKKI